MCVTSQADDELEKRTKITDKRVREKLVSLHLLLKIYLFT